MNKTGLFHNKLLALILSPQTRLYTKTERQRIGRIVGRNLIYKNLIPAILEGAKKHIYSREQAIIKRCKHSQLSEKLTTACVIETLMDLHFRKQRNKGISVKEISENVFALTENKKPINLVGLMFTRKNISPIKRNGGDESLTDLAEVVSLIHLNSYSELLNRFHPWGVKFRILSEGKRFSDIFDYSLQTALNYQKNLKKWIDILGLKYLSIYDYEDIVNSWLSQAQIEVRKNSHKKAAQIYKKIMLPILNSENIESTIQKAAVLDPRNDAENPGGNFVRVWKSILNSLPYSPLQDYARNIGVDYDYIYLSAIRSIFIPNTSLTMRKFRTEIIHASWNATINYNSLEMGDSKTDIQVSEYFGPQTFRTTINPKHGSQLGIYTVRETATRVHPWHGTGFLQTDNQGFLKATVLSKLELESKSAIPIYIDRYDDKPFCYATAEAVRILQKGEINFNASTK